MHVSLWIQSWDNPSILKRKKTPPVPEFERYDPDILREQYIDYHGYVHVWIPPDNPYYPMSQRGWIAEHRYVMAICMGRCLATRELVHHINGIKTDNRVNNLKLIPLGESHPRAYNRAYQDGYKQGLQDAQKELSLTGKNP